MVVFREGGGRCCFYYQIQKSIRQMVRAVWAADGMRDKPPIEELLQFLEFQLPKQWAPVFGELPLGPDRKQYANASLQFSFMGPKLYVNTTLNAVDMALADSGCSALENPDLRLACFANKALVNVGGDLAKLVLGRVSTEVDARLAYDTHGIINV